MKRLILSSLLLAVLAMPALTGSPPVKSRNTPDAVANACGALGANGETLTMGCRNTTTGAAVTCKADGTCTDYFADPRYGKIKAVLDAIPIKSQQAPLKSL